MPVNPFFQKGDAIGNENEQNLIDQLTVELIKIYGLDCKYIPRTVVKEDKLFMEDVNSSFDKHWTLEMALEDADGGFQQDARYVGKFGFEYRDDTSLFVSVYRFRQETGLEKPLEGDLLYFPLANRIFEITYVSFESMFYQLGKLFVFKLDVKTFEFSHEDFATGVDEVDDLATALENDNDVSNDGFAKNDDIETRATDALDFSEDNPFGDY